MTRQVRIQSDGDPANTIITTETGEDISSKITEAFIVLNPSDPTEVSLTVVQPYIDVHGLAKEIVFTCPVCEHQITHECPGPPRFD